ncbi:hypothetical protein [Sinanaerobacter sp. ZZT-01]|uniref:hypothetical protein n=1 Tax=Sinanaerobacter sp. ZZT-01 TaxID=3111540 RepID=UPI002D78EAF3|nr:hypothetical protein [Sinanaerobacter sp. ZZT-01]WRR93383.1 hypothetical protein U5921_15340 [Sinanaerobacter sp. ZZT-01]
MEDKKEKSRTYIIPHNYKNNGRILNLFEREQIKKTLICIVPITLILCILPIPITVKAFLGVFLIGAPAGVFLFELDRVMIDMFTFFKSRRIYYGGEGRYWYEVEKRKQIARRKRVKP